MSLLSIRTSALFSTAVTFIVVLFLSFLCYYGRTLSFGKALTCSRIVSSACYRTKPQTANLTSTGPKFGWRFLGASSTTTRHCHHPPSVHRIMASAADGNESGGRGDSSLHQSSSADSMTVTGRMFLYSTEKRLPAFQYDCFAEEGSEAHDKHPQYNKYVIFIGGLTDGFLCVPYLRPLAKRLHELGWSLIQPLLSSSYNQYGMSSLNKDAKELDELVRALGSRGAERVVVIGHSTGCQDCVHYMNGDKWGGRPSPLVKGLVLQAPVSDREYLATKPGTAKLLEVARKMDPEELMPRDAMGPDEPITAGRYLSLADVNGDDDLFSSDFDESRMSTLLRHLTVPTLVCYSMQEEYVPGYVNKEELASRLTAALPKGRLAQPAIQGNHALSSSLEAQEQFVSAVESFLTDL